MRAITILENVRLIMFWALIQSTTVSFAALATTRQLIRTIAPLMAHGSMVDRQEYQSITGTFFMARWSVVPRHKAILAGSMTGAIFRRMK